MFVWLRMPWEFVRLMTRKSSAAQRNYTNRLTVSHSRLLETQLGNHNRKPVRALVVRQPHRYEEKLMPDQPERLARDQASPSKLLTQPCGCGFAFPTLPPVHRARPS